MTYPDFPFPPSTPLYPNYHYIQAYHADYAEHYGLFPHIRLNHSVSSALWVGNSTQGHWDVTLQTDYPVEIIPGSSKLPSTADKDELTERFDHLVIANGHNHYPQLPEWAMNSEWLAGREGRRIIHSIYYREPQDYVGKKVLVVGAGASGADIASQIPEYAEEVRIQTAQLLSHPYLNVFFRRTTPSEIRRIAPTFHFYPLSYTNRGRRT